MILTNCAACAAPLAHNAPRCVRCQTRYCDATCQHDHWRRGHKQICKKIHRGGNAEHYHANKKYKEAVAVAVEACADDTKGQKCYICREAVHRRTGEGLVRGCSCGDRDGVASGKTGIAHVSCLVEQAKILFGDCIENRLGTQSSETWGSSFDHWFTCSLCERRYHGVVACALGWACWKTYLGHHLCGHHSAYLRSTAMGVLGNALRDRSDALSVYKAQLDMLERHYSSEDFALPAIMQARGNVSTCLCRLNRVEEALELREELYAKEVASFGPTSEAVMISICNIAIYLFQLKRWPATRAYVKRHLPTMEQVVGLDHEYTIKMRSTLASVLYIDPNASVTDVREALVLLDGLEKQTNRVLGKQHPTAVTIQNNIILARGRLGQLDSAALNAELRAARARGEIPYERLNMGLRETE